MHGLLVIDKPYGLSSHAVVSRLRKLLHQRRIGHTGTLDPMATGVLPVAVGEGTRVIPFLHEELKTYRATIALGAATDTQDAEGDVIFEGSLEGVSEDAVRSVIAAMHGEIEQLPPMFSAIKQNGVPLYKLARQGQEVERKKRRIIVHDWRLDEYEQHQLVCTIDCSRGTYVRTLAHDLGQKLGCGAHLSALRRLRSGRFEISQAISLDEVADLIAAHKALPEISLAEALSHRIQLQLDVGALPRLLDGVPPNREQVLDELPQSGSEVSLLCHGCLVATALYAPERERERRGDFELQRVFNQVREVM